MAEVVGLRGVVPVGEPVAEVVEALEGLLERARSGRLRAVAYVTVGADGAVGTAWSLPPELGHVSRGVEGHALASGILSLGWRYGEAGNAD
jgi:hypothetical protein